MVEAILTGALQQLSSSASLLLFTLCLKLFFQASGYVPPFILLIKVIKCLKCLFAFVLVESSIQINICLETRDGRYIFILTHQQAFIESN